MIKLNQFSLPEFAFNHHNKNIFNNELEFHLYSINRNDIMGFFSGEVLTKENWKDKSFHIKLLHYMLHLVQEKERTASPRGYHNKRFAELSDKIDLPATVTGLPGGKNTGQYMSHYCIPNGISDNSINIFPTDNIEFELIPVIESNQNSGKSSWIKYKCPCGNIVKARPNTMNVSFNCWEILLAQDFNDKEKPLECFVNEEIAITTLMLLKEQKDQIYNKLSLELLPVFQEKDKTDAEIKLMVKQKSKNFINKISIGGNL